MSNVNPYGPLTEGIWPDHLCKVCGSNLTGIRGRHPNEQPRLICATCAYEKLETIREITAADYMIARKASPPKT